MKTYEEGYEWGKALCARLKKGEGSPTLVLCIAKSAKAYGNPVAQGKIDACRDWLKKQKQLLALQDATTERKEPKGESRTHETAH